VVRVKWERKGQELGVLVHICGAKFVVDPIVPVRCRHRSAILSRILVRAADRLRSIVASLASNSVPVKTKVCIFNCVYNLIGIYPVERDNGREVDEYFEEI